MNIDAITENLVRWVVAARGQQVHRKDKDLMRDTGGTSKGREREPHKKPPRDDVKDRYRDKKLKPTEKDEDTNDDKDREVKKPVRRHSFVHPLDRLDEGAWTGLSIPENNYHRRVYGALWNIIENEQAISEKDFSGQDEIRVMCESVVRNSASEETIQRFRSQAQRPTYCAECIYSRMQQM